MPTFRACPLDRHGMEKQGIAARSKLPESPSCTLASRHLQGTARLALPAPSQPKTRSSAAFVEASATVDTSRPRADRLPSAASTAGSSRSLAPRSVDRALCARLPFSCQSRSCRPSFRHGAFVPPPLLPHQCGHGLLRSVSFQQ